MVTIIRPRRTHPQEQSACPGKGRLPGAAGTGSSGVENEQGKKYCQPLFISLQYEIVEMMENVTGVAWSLRAASGKPGSRDASGSDED
jgi:hypothetical protein